MINKSDLWGLRVFLQKKKTESWSSGIFLKAHSLTFGTLLKEKLKDHLIATGNNI